VRPVPTALHLGPLTFHLYGLGLALASYVTYRYGRRRLAGAGLDPEPFFAMSLWIVAAGLVGARVAHLATNWGYYSSRPGLWIAVWQGGLASFGGIALALPVGLAQARRRWPEAPLRVVADALVPALVAGWALGRVLGPQFMVAGGGHRTSQWFGLRYAGQAGRRVPVPLIQGAEDALLWGGLLWLERRHLAPGRVAAAAMVVWGLVRALDERLLLGQQSHSGSLGVQGAGLALALGGAVFWWRAGRLART
jgi:phosphatidylglycerol:prolipoprotein diacylglycerol transferase